MVKVARNATHTCIIFEHDAENPREFYDPFGHMVCWHRRYNLGDKHAYESPDEFLEAMCHRYVPGFTSPEDLTFTTMQDLLAEVPGFVILPLYLYDHSGLSLSTRPFNDPWDSGRVGWIYATPEDVRALHGDLLNASVVSARILLKESVREYDLYLRGVAYAFELYENDGTQIDYCSNIFFDFNVEDHICKNYLPSEAHFRASDFEDYPGVANDYLCEHNLL